MCSSDSRPMMHVLLEQMPDLILPIFDRAIKHNKLRHHDLNFQLTFDMKYSKIIISLFSSSKTFLTLNVLRELIFPIPLYSTIVPKESSSSCNFEKEPGTGPPRREMDFLNNLLKSSSQRNLETYKNILRHPLVHVFTDLKWSQLKFIYFLYLMVQINILLCYNVFLFLTIYVDCPIGGNPSNDSNSADSHAGTI